MEFFADYHTHTVHSDGRGTITDNAIAAREKGLEIVGISDHGPKNIGVGVENPQTYIDMRKEIKQAQLKVPEVEIKLGAEADIISLDGKIDIPHETVEELDFLIVGLHPYVWGDSIQDFFSLVAGNQLTSLSRSLRNKVRLNNTKSLIECLYKYDVFCISHPGLKMEVEYRELAEHCVKKDVVLEINTGHRYNKSELIKQVLPTGVNFVVNSDAHFPETVGQLLEGKLLLDKLDVPVNRIINARLK